MSDTEILAPEGYTVSFKTDESYSAALVVVRGADSKNLEKNLDKLNADLIQKIVDTRQLVLKANLLVDDAAKSKKKAAKKAAKGEGGGQAGDPNVKTCAHGVREKKEGTSSRGKWTGWFCPQPKGASDKCDPIWG